MAVKTAVENAADQPWGGGPVHRHLRQPDGEGHWEIFDIVVAANIVADVIIQLTKDAQRFMKHSTLYIISGIIDPEKRTSCGPLPPRSR